MKLFVGIDVSSEKLDVCFLDSSDTTLKEVTLPNNINGASSIKEDVLQFHQSFNYEKIVIGMESTSIYSFHPATFLSEDLELKSLGLVEVVIQNPKSIHRYKGLFEEDKNDRIDAFRIADFLRIERFNKTVLKEERYVALQRLTRSRYQMVHQLTECKQHFLENLYYKCNTLSKELDTSVFGATMLDLLSDALTLDEMAEMELEDLANLLQEKGRGRFSDPQKLAKTIKKAIRDSYRLGKVVQESVDMVLATYARLIQTLKKQIKDLEKSIVALFEIVTEAQCLKSIPGIGIVYESERTPLTRTGNQYLRYYMVEAANSIRRHEDTYRLYYQKKYDEVPKFKHKRALVLTARKLVRLVDTLLRNHQLYTPERSVSLKS